MISQNNVIVDGRVKRKGLRICLKMKGNGEKLHSGEERHNFNDPVICEEKELYIAQWRSPNTNKSEKGENKSYKALA